MTASSADPRHFLTGFRTSINYRQAWGAFFQGKLLAADVTEAEQREVFEASDQAHIALINYAQQMPFEYDAGYYTPQTRTAITAYIRHVQFIHRQTMQRLDRDTIIELDRKRSELHHAAARAMLKDGIVLTMKLGRTLARLVLVAEGIETYQDAMAMT